MLKSMGVLLLASGEAGLDLNRKEKRKREKDEEKRRMRLRVSKMTSASVAWVEALQKRSLKSRKLGPLFICIFFQIFL